jgi:hypothetical protein
MDDLLYFLTKNPVAAIFIAWFLYRFFFGGKNKAKKAQEQQQAQMKASGAQKKSFQERLEEALKEAQSATQPGAQSGQQTLLESTRVAVPQPVEMKVSTERTGSPQVSSEANDPFAFHSLTGQAVQRTDYDLNKDSFAYHDAINEPVEQAFHLKGFTGFHEAHGLSHGSSIMPSPSPDEESQPSSSTPDFLGTEGGWRQSIILNEIIGRPRALRRFGQ